ncbi:hypothetical protein EBS40_02085 [bacterium]|nr:hypothetical protein [bacterium]
MFRIAAMLKVIRIWKFAPDVENTVRLSPMIVWNATTFPVMMMVRVSEPYDIARFKVLTLKSR